jgi:hypothetical protein
MTDPSRNGGAKRVAILEHAPAATSATGVRGRAIAEFLRRRGHTVEIIAPTEAEMCGLARKRTAVRTRIVRRLARRRALPHMWDLVADSLMSRVRSGRYDIVIARSQDVGTVLTRGIDGLAVYDMANVGFLEEYHAWGANLDDVEDTYRREVRLLESADVILSPHSALTEYFTRHFDERLNLAAKTRTLRLGAEPAARTASFSNPPRIVYAGSYYYIQDPYLLSELTKISPIPIDCYGFRNPNRSFLPAPLAYFGFQTTIDFLADYQFGLITVSRDALRKHSPATKFPYYFMHGLPVLFPEWMLEGYDYPDCAVPYNEGNFVEQVSGASNPMRWRAMNVAALARARTLTWDQVLQPLEEIVG